MLNIGFSEMVLIIGLALVVLGPEKLPKLVKTIGHWVGRARTMARQFQDQLATEAETIKSSVGNVTKDVEQSFSEVRTTLTDAETAVTEVQTAVTEAVQPPVEPPVEPPAAPPSEPPAPIAAEASEGAITPAETRAG
jgi:sec-independent protein translocase protein TatB